MPSLWARPNGPVNQFAVNQAAFNQQAAVTPLMPATLVLLTAAEAVVPHPQNSAQAYVVPLSPNQGNEASPFDLVISGYLVSTTNSAMTFKLYSGKSLTVAANSLMASFTAVTQNNITCPFELHAHLLYDSVSGKMHGYFDGMVNFTLQAKTAITAQTGMNDNNNPVANFVLSLTSSLAAATTPTTLVIRNFTVG